MTYYKRERKKKGSVYQVQASATVAPGEHRTIYATAYSLKDAKKKEEELRNRVAVEADTLTVREGIERYLSDKKLRVKPTTYSSSWFILEKHVVPYIGDYMITKVTARVVRNLQNEWLKKGYKPSYLNLLNSKLSALFNYFIRFYDLSKNPVKLAGTLGNRYAKEMKFWTLQEFQTFYSGLDPENDKAYCVLFQVLFFTGMRIGEAMALEPDDIDLQNGYISINKTYVVVDGEEILQDPKTHNSKRKISIPKFLVDMLADFIKLLPSNDTRLFFQISKYSLWRKMRSVCKKTGVKLIRVHDIRHSAVAFLIAQGVPIMEISKRCGHRSPDITYRVYAHLYPKKEESVAQLLDRLHTSQNSEGIEK